MLIIVLLLSLSHLGRADNRWGHGWATSAEMTFADFNPRNLLTDTEAQFAASKYKILSLEKCTAIGSGVKTEEAIYTTARQLKKIDPTIKVMFYLATDQQGLGCYAANDTMASHPEWWLKDDKGKVITSHGNPLLDCTVKAARDWWTSIPLLGDGDGTFQGQPVSELIDGVLADSAGWSNYPGISQARLEALVDAKFQMLAELQDKMTTANGGKVMANGISMYGGPNEDPRFPDGHNLQVLRYTDAIMNEHTCVFESVDSRSNSFHMDTVSANLDAILAASQMNNGSKTVFVQTWPGLYVNTQFTPTATEPAKVYPPGGEPTPQNNAEWRDALRRHFGFAHALFLSIAESNMYWMYAGYWYSGDTGYLPCDDHPDACPAPSEWYPDLYKPLGAPLGSRVSVGTNIWTREFEHAHVYLNLNDPNASKVSFH